MTWDAPFGNLERRLGCFERRVNGSLDEMRDQLQGLMEMFTRQSQSSMKKLTPNILENTERYASSFSSPPPSSNWNEYEKEVRRPKEATTQRLQGEMFGGRCLSNVVEEFYKIKQDGSVREYEMRFEELMALMLNHNPYLTESYFVSSFLIGLNEELRPMVTGFQPKTLKQAADSARLQELTLKVLKKKQRGIDTDGTAWDQANGIKRPEESYIDSTEIDPEANELELAIRKKLEVEKRHSFDGILVLKQAELSLAWDEIGNEKLKTALPGGKLRDIAEEAKGFDKGNTTFAAVLVFTSTSKSKWLSTTWRDESLAEMEVAATPNVNDHKQPWYEHSRQVCKFPLLHFEAAVDISSAKHGCGLNGDIVTTTMAEDLPFLLVLDGYEVFPIEILGQFILGINLENLRMKMKRPKCRKKERRMIHIEKVGVG